MFGNSFLWLIIGAGALIVGASIFLLLRRLRAETRLKSELSFALYEVTLPPAPAPAAEKGSFRDRIAVMEQFYVGMTALFEKRLFIGRTSYALEIGLPSVGEEISFFVAVPAKRARLFEKQLSSVFPQAHIELRAEDYNIFNPSGIAAAGILTLEKNPALSTRTYQRLDADPLEIIANAFSKLQKEGEGAALQLVVSSAPSGFRSKLKKAAAALRAGKNIKSVLQEFEEGRRWLRDALDAMIFLISGQYAFKKAENAMGPAGLPKPSPLPDTELIKLVEEKANAPVVAANIRIVASAPTQEEADTILKEIASAFLQFAEPAGNAFRIRIAEGRELKKALYQFTFREFSPKQSAILTTRELTSIYHFPVGTTAPAIKILRGREAPPPVGVASEGILLGINEYRGQIMDIRLGRDDRRRHLYVIGQTGTGKTALLQNLVAQDIRTGEGVCVIDPHGDMAESILGLVPPERAHDVIYFDPGNIDRPIGLNFLEYDPAYPEQKTFIINELLEIFKKLYAGVPEALGPMFETYFRNATLLVIEDPSSGNTLLEIERVMADKEFRDLKLSHSRNPIVNAFWKDVAERTGGEASLANMVPYITSKFDTFLTNEIMRPILLQEHSSFRFRDVLDQKKILIVNLSKGRVGETNAALLGLIIVGKIAMAAFSRVDTPEDKRADFYLYLDEFQNVITPTISTILSEARKYRLSLIMAHQFLGQLTDDIRKAVIGTVGSMAAFRIGADDAEALKNQFEPVFGAPDLMNIENYRAYVRLLVRGETRRAFNIATLPPESGDSARASAIKAQSAQVYGRRRAEIDMEIQKRYQ
ncbi:MAG: type IV secretion system DNA-binding domain-containing protein [Candidatus Niyogibacteria bacterium]|nr:type IV secretion system DNA-binding domain-containing protein [Candidatus Niyogibacteria bacterium]